MEGNLKRIRFRHDGRIDFEIETEDGKRATAAGCSLHINETDYGDRQHLQHGLPGGDDLHTGMTTIDGLFYTTTDLTD